MTRRASTGARFRRARRLVVKGGAALAGAALGMGACGEGPTGTRGGPPPAITAAAVAPNAYHVLGAMVSARATNADSVVVRHRLDGATVDDATPAVVVAGDTATLPVLGLLPERRYVMRVVAFGAGGVTVGDPLDFTTGALPADLPAYVASGPDPSPGFVLVSTPRYALVIDNGGRVVWYRLFANGLGLNFMAQPTGRYVVRPPTPTVGDVEPWLELEPGGAVARSLACARGLQSRPHDILLEDDGSVVLLCDEVRTMDLTAIGGVAAARVMGTVVQHVGPSGDLRFEWSAFDHFDVADLAPAERSGATVNWTHGNAIDRDPEGHLVVSFRNLNEITRIHARTGAVLWRLGGVRNQFTFLDAPPPPFVHQHGARAYAPGALLLLDNLGDRGASRAEHWAIDAAARTVRLERSYAASPAVVTEIGGSVQPLAGGRTLVSFGTAGRVEEYDDAGRLVWRIQGNPGYVFRAQRIRSLYAPGVGTPR